jgi:hypothetical protein
MASKPEIIPHVFSASDRMFIDSLKPVIMNKKLISFWYRDTMQSKRDFEGMRIIEPYLIGQEKFKAAKILLIGYFLPTEEQIELKGMKEDWWQFDISGIRDLNILDQTYKCRARFNPKDTRMERVFCAIENNYDYREWPPFTEPK